MILKNLDIYRGDTCIYDVAIEDKSGIPLDLSVGKVLMSVQASDGTTISPEVLVSKGKVGIVFEANQTQSFGWKSASYDLRFILDGNVVTLAKGFIRVAPSIADISPFLGDINTASRMRKATWKIIADKGILPSIVVPDIDPNLPDLIEFYMTHGAS